MRNGVVIACVGVVAAAAIAVVVYTQPQSSAAKSDLVPQATVREGAVRSPAKVTHAPVATRPAARPAHAETAAVPVKDSVLPAAYRVLLTRSIFCPHGVGQKSSAKSTEPTFTLLGVVQSERAFIAYIENSASGVSREVRVGDTVGQKKVINIDFHSVEFVEGKRAMKVAVGEIISSAGNGSALATVRPQFD